MSQIPSRSAADKHMCFDFEKLPVSLMRTLQLMDRSIIEYRTDPKAIVMLTYTLEKSGRRDTSVEHTEMLHNVYEGIFEKDFTLFYGEKMVCMIHEEKRRKKTQSGPV